MKMKRFNEEVYTGSPKVNLSCFREFDSPDWSVIFDLQIFSDGVYPPSATSRTISVSISNSFGDLVRLFQSLVMILPRFSSLKVHN